MTSIAVIIGHPLPDSLTSHLAHAYATAASRHADVTVIDLAHPQFALNPEVPGDLRAPAGDLSHLDGDIASWIDTLTAADHVALFFPQWWGTYPAVLKAFIDRVFISGVAFRAGDKLPDRLWRGKTARITATMDSPRWWNAVIYRDAMVSSLRYATLAYVGIRTIGVSRLPEVRHASDSRRARWIADASRAGERDARRLVGKGAGTGGSDGGVTATAGALTVA